MRPHEWSGDATRPSCRLSRRGLLATAAKVVGAGTLAGLAGCALHADRDHDGPDVPAAGALPKVPRVAWVLGSGGPRGFVHVGVVKALAELGLVPDVIVGASAGALVGALCAGGLDAGEIERLALTLRPWDLLRWNVAGPERLAGDALAALVNQRLQGRRLQDLPIPLVCAVQRLRDGAVIGFTHGDTGLAVQASAAIEGQFAPLRVRGERYADADLRMPLPVRLARRFGALRVLAVDASAHEERAPAGAEAYRDGDRRKRALTQPDAVQADVLLHPDFGYWAGMSKAYRERAIAAGYRDTMARAAELRLLHSA